MDKLKSVVTFFLGVIIVVVSTVPVSAQSLHQAEVITKGYQFTEGPFWHPDGYLLFSDIPANTIYKWHPDSADAAPYIKPSGHSNGLTWDPTENRVIVAQHEGRISAIRGDTLHSLVSEYQGKRLNSPNDVAVKSDGTIYFTDPPFGVPDSLKELNVNGVYRFGTNGDVELLYDELELPNGIAFSPNEQTLYVNDSGEGRILAFDVTSDGSISLPSEFANVGPADSTGAADGMVVDRLGRVYSTGPGGIYVFSEKGEQLRKIKLPARATNLEWGGGKQQSLYITTPSAIYRLQLDGKLGSND